MQKYRPGKNMEIANTSSRPYLQNERPSKFESTEEAINLLQFLPTAPDRLEDIQNQTTKDIALQNLSSTKSNGWPEIRNSIPDIIGPYFDILGELTIQNGDFSKETELSYTSTPQGYAEENSLITPWS